MKNLIIIIFSALVLFACQSNKDAGATAITIEIIDGGWGLNIIGYSMQFTSTRKGAQRVDALVFC